MVTQNPQDNGLRRIWLSSALSACMQNQGLLTILN